MTSSDSGVDDMSGRRGRSLSTVANGLVECGPTAIYLWLLRTTRMANPDPAIHTQARFGRLLDHDGTFVSHIEAGRRPLPSDLRDRWFQLIGLPAAGLANYLACVDVRQPQPLWFAPLEQPQLDADYDLVDRALDGELLTPSQWTRACHAAPTLGLPRAIRRFSRRAVDALAVCNPAHYSSMVNALLFLPGHIVADAARESIETAPARAYLAVEALGELDGSLSGPILRHFFREMPGPWLERSLAESMRRIVSRGEVTTLADDPTALQHSLVHGLNEATSWLARVEIANLACALGPLPASLHDRLANDPDGDVRLVVQPHPSESAQAAIRTLREQAVAHSLDKMYGSPVEDPLADRLVAMMMTARTRRARMRAAQALAISPYSAQVSTVLTSLTRTPAATEVRRAAVHALYSFPTTAELVSSLTTTALDDVDPEVRGRAVSSLLAHCAALPQRLFDAIVQDSDPVVRRYVPLLADRVGNEPALRIAMADKDPIVSQHARLLAAVLP
jgi:hypothetical protein